MQRCRAGKREVHSAFNNYANMRLLARWEEKGKGKGKKKKERRSQTNKNSNMKTKKRPLSVLSRRGEMRKKKKEKKGVEFKRKDDVGRDKCE